MSGQTLGKIIIINLSFRVGTSKIKIWTIELKKLVLLSQHKLHVKQITSLYSCSAMSSALNSCFYVFHCNLKNKDYIGRYVK